MHEELGLALPVQDLHRRMESRTLTGDLIWFFVSEQPDFDPETVCFGDEGQGWRLVGIDWFLTHPKVIPRHCERLRAYLEIRGSLASRRVEEVTQDRSPPGEFG